MKVPFGRGNFLYKIFNNILIPISDEQELTGSIKFRRGGNPIIRNFVLKRTKKILNT